MRLRFGERLLNNNNNNNNNETEKNDKKKKSTIKTIIWTVIWIAIIIAGVFLTFFILGITLNTDTPLTVVSGQSMQPTYYEGDLLIVQGKDYEEIIVGDHEAKNGSVIVYKRSYDGLLIVHRVVDVRFNYSGNEIYEFRAQGDNDATNPTPDPGWIPQQNIKGVVIFRIPFLGWISLVFTKYRIIGFSIIGIIIVLLIITSFDNKENKEKEEKSKDFLDNEGDKIQCLMKKKLSWI
ncbi:MAG: signal peptidase I [Candidatus Lokiarchaeota archaeon]|nr:signal peptidase I [Candidatus Lokiarchaeota archaeon]